MTRAIDLVHVDRSRKAVVVGNFTFVPLIYFDRRFWDLRHTATNKPVTWVKDLDDGKTLLPECEEAFGSEEVSKIVSPYQKWRDEQLADKATCCWGEFGDIDECDVSTQCGHAMIDYDGDEMHWDVHDGDPCPFCGKPVKRVNGWLL